MKIYHCIVLLLITPTIFGQEWNESFAKTLTKAKGSNKFVLLVFSGSDWCAPCIRLDKNIWQSDGFRAYAESGLLLYRADFPKKKANRLTKILAEQNATLAEKYNPNGNFPLVLLLDKNGYVLGRTGFMNSNPEEYIQHLKSFAN